MGCAAEIIVLGGRTLGVSRAMASSGLELLADLESAWSRFLPDSDVSNFISMPATSSACTERPANSSDLRVRRGTSPTVPSTRPSVP